MTGLDKLRTIGANKICEQTHIAKKFIQNILDEEFSTMNKIQFAGFISILEREYNIDLHEFIEAYNTSLNVQNRDTIAPLIVSAADSESKSFFKTFYILIPFAIVIGIYAYNNFSSLSEKKSVLEKKLEPKKTEVKTLKAVTAPIDSELNNTIIEEAKLNLNNLETNVATEAKEMDNIKEVKEKALEELPGLKHVSQFLIIPKSKIWIGIINLENFNRHQKLTSSAFELDPNKEWLLVMGHGYIKFEVNGEEKSFKDKNKTWFAYENGILTKISKSEFKKKNRGKAW